MSRRQALCRFGFRAAGATLAAFTVDDLARAVMNRMAKEEAMRGITDGVAKELKNSGVAFADFPGTESPCSACVGTYCKEVQFQDQQQHDCTFCYDNSDPVQCQENRDFMISRAKTEFNACVAANCSSGAPLFACRRVRQYRPCVAVTPIPT